MPRLLLSLPQEVTPEKGEEAELNINDEGKNLKPFLHKKKNIFESKNYRHRRERKKYQGEKYLKRYFRN